MGFPYSQSISFQWWQGMTIMVAKDPQVVRVSSGAFDFPWWVSLIVTIFIHHPGLFFIQMAGGLLGDHWGPAGVMGTLFISNGFQSFLISFIGWPLKSRAYGGPMYWGTHVLAEIPGTPFHFQRGSRSQSGSPRTQETHEKNKTFPQKHHHNQISASFLMSHLTGLRWKKNISYHHWAWK